MQESFIGMYAAMDGSRVLGVYRNEAEAAKAGELLEIAVRHLNGSPEMAGCVWLAGGRVEHGDDGGRQGDGGAL